MEHVLCVCESWSRPRQKGHGFQKSGKIEDRFLREILLFIDSIGLINGIYEYLTVDERLNKPSRLQCRKFKKNVFSWFFLNPLLIFRNP